MLVMAMCPGMARHIAGVPHLVVCSHCNSTMSQYWACEQVTEGLTGVGTLSVVACARVVLHDSKGLPVVVGRGARATQSGTCHGR